MATPNYGYEKRQKELAKKKKKEEKLKDKAHRKQNDDASPNNDPGNFNNAGNTEAKVALQNS